MPKGLATASKTFHLSGDYADGDGPSSTSLYTRTGANGDATSRVIAGDEEDIDNPIKPVTKSRARVAFEIGHRVLGFSILGLAFYNCSTGLVEFEGAAGVPLFAGCQSVLWTAVGSTLGVVAVLYYYQAKVRN